MRNRLLALIALGCLCACAAAPPPAPSSPPSPLAATPPARLATSLTVPPPATQCRVLPVTEHVWREGYPQMLDSFDQKDMLYPLYVGLSTLSWAVITPLLPVADATVLPMRIFDAQSCL